MNRDEKTNATHAPVDAWPEDRCAEDRPGAQSGAPATESRVGTAEASADITTRADCERLVRAFYTRALVDPVIGFLFTDVAHLDLEAHVPRITAFWETVLLGARSYGGGAFRPHLELNMRVALRRGHFDRWLHLWAMTVDELFAGEHAEQAKAHAIRVAVAFHSRLRSSEPEGPAAGADNVGPGPLLPMVAQYARSRQS